MVIPLDVELLGLSQDTATAVPTVTTYNYVVAGERIAIVEPESRKVIQIIKRQQRSVGAPREPDPLEWRTLLVMGPAHPAFGNITIIPSVGSAAAGAERAALAA